METPARRTNSLPTPCRRPVPTFTFKISDALPADDAVARFITAAAMMSNDWLRLWHEMDAIDDADPDADARRIWSFRLQAALHFEAARFLTETQRRVPDVARFVAGLGEAAHADYDRVTAAMDPTSSHSVGGWFKVTGTHLPLLDDAP